MAAIMPDHNVEGHFGVMLRILADDPWRVLWAEMGFEIASFETL